MTSFGYPRMHLITSISSMAFDGIPEFKRRDPFADLCVHSDVVIAHSLVTESFFENLAKI